MLLWCVTFLVISIFYHNSLFYVQTECKLFTHVSIYSIVTQPILSMMIKVGLGLLKVRVHILCLHLNASCVWMYHALDMTASVDRSIYNEIYLPHSWMNMTPNSYYMNSHIPVLTWQAVVFVIWSLNQMFDLNLFYTVWTPATWRYGLWLFETAGILLHFLLLKINSIKNV